jgi:transcription termination/antitermination protein NusG
MSTSQVFVDQRPAPAMAPRWRAVWTRSNCEQLVFDQLAGKGFRAFLPKMAAWSRRGGRAHRILEPMFPGYLFLHDVLDSRRYVEVLKTRGIVGVLGQRWDRLAEVPEREIAAVRQLDQIELPVEAHPYLAEGVRVRIHSGSLAGIEGILVKSEPSKSLLVVSVELLRRSVAVEVNRAFVAAA